MLISRTTAVVVLALQVVFFVGSSYLAWNCYWLHDELVVARWQVQEERRRVDEERKRAEDNYLNGWRDSRLP